MSDLWAVLAMLLTEAWLCTMKSSMAKHMTGYKNRLLQESTVAPVLARGVEQAVAAVPAEYKKEWMGSWGSLSQGLQLSK